MHSIIQMKNQLFIIVKIKEDKIDRLFPDILLLYLEKEEYCNWMMI